MTLPETQDAMLRAGYKFDLSTKCVACTAPIEYWSKPGPDLESIIVDVMPRRYSKAVLHATTCKQQQLFG